MSTQEQREYDDLAVWYERYKQRRAEQATLPPITESDNRPDEDRAWHAWHTVEWRVRALHSHDGQWRVQLTLYSYHRLEPAEAYRLSETITRAAAYCEQREREAKAGAST